MKALNLMSGATLLATLACGHPEAPKAPELPTATVRILPPQGGAEAGWVAANLQRADQATLSTRLAGMVKRVLVSEGAHVAQGQLLIELEASDLLGQMKAAQSARDAAAAHHRRIQTLQAQGAATPSEAEAAATHLAQAEGGIAAIQGQLAYAQIRAPFAGTVQRRDIQAGAFAGPGQPLLTLEGSGSLELTASLSEAEAAGLKSGQKVVFDTEGRKGQAQITALAVGGDPLTHRQSLRARVLSPTDLRSGAFARLQVPGATGSKDLRIPISALLKRGELSGVFVAEQGHAHLRWINLGETQGASVEVRAGLKAADRVIAEPGELKDGQPIVEGSHAK